MIDLKTVPIQELQAELRRRKWNEYQKGRAKKRRSDPLNHMLQNARNRAQAAGEPFRVKRADVTIPALCPVERIALMRDRVGTDPNSPVLVKVDPRGEYEPNNVWVISRQGAYALQLLG